MGTSEASAAFLSGLRPVEGLDAVLLLKRSGTHLASWIRTSASHEVLTVMAATAMGSVQTIIESLGASSPREISIETEGHRIFVAAMEPNAMLVLIGRRTARETSLRQEARRLLGTLRIRDLLRSVRTVKNQTARGPASSNERPPVHAGPGR
jgi:predicted regulator of Ras-like GTPase activity (Roadblock/LC7/MglB family)